MKYSGLSLLRSGNMAVGYLKNCFLVSLAIAQIAMLGIKNK